MATAPPPVVQSRPRWRLWLRIVILFTAVPYLGLVILMAVFQRSLIYVPRRVPALPLSSATLPEATAEEVIARTEDALELHGWWLTVRAPLTASREQHRAGGVAHGRPLVLYFCGNAGHRGYRIPEFDLLTSLGADVLCCDYRGYGVNAGSPSEDGLAADARAVWKLATQDRGVEPERIVLFGESLGGGVAVRLAAELCAAGTPPAGLVTRSTFSSLDDVAATAFPWLPTRWLLRDRFPSAIRITQVTCPIELIHGERDTIVPHALGRKLFAAAPPQSSGGVPKRMVDLPKADHNDVLETEGRAFYAAIDEFLRGIGLRRVTTGE